MSEPKLISPMLDNFDMGGPISDHDGVRCCPAMRKDSDDKYIVKIISVPASQTKMDALLLTGAYSDKNSALAYFMDVAKGLVDEKKILDDLAQLEGFVPFEDSQIVPMEDGSGYDVYLLSPYRMTLKRQYARSAMTQLAAVNLGLDLCSSLAVARRCGYLCVDLKPSNIYVVGDKEYKIGDLGYIKLSSLKYKTLPDMYRSSYTAPEVEDAFASLNDTLDIYSVGLILYQVFNNGELPFSGNHAPAEKFAAPVFADEEMAQIILKACDPDPAERWSDPVQMGQALVNYMQKNGVNDLQLTAANFGPQEEPAEEEPSVIADESEAVEPIAETEANAIAETNDDGNIIAELDNLIAELTDDCKDEEEKLSLVEEISSAVINNDQEDDASKDEVTVEDAIAEPEKTEAEITENCEQIEADENIAVEVTEIVEAAETADEPADDLTATEEVAEVEYDNLSFLDGWEAETEQALSDLAENYDDISTDVSEMLDRIDEIAAYEVPDPVVAPEPIEITIPDPITNDDLAPEVVVEAEEEVKREDIEEETEIPEEELPYIPKKKHTGRVLCIILAILIALGIGGYFFYTQYYLQSIDSFEVEGYEDVLQVNLTADVDESLLMIVCADSHGNKVSAPVSGGRAIFSGLSPDTAYTVSVEIEGFHQLTGTTSKVYSTPDQTKIVHMSAITGSEDGSVILSFTPDGPDSEQWNVIYSAEGEAERVTAFPAHTVTLTGLTVGKEYTFRLEPIDEIYLSEVPELTYVAQNLICAENLHVTACYDGILTAQWDIPENETVSKWIVRCYNETGYDETLITAENSITFQNVDDTVANTVEVTAAGMSVNQLVLVSANSVTISEFKVDDSRDDVMKLSWNANREIPAEGWTVQYTVDGISALESLTTTENAIEIPVVPYGEYVFTILDSTGNAVLGGPFTHTQGSASDFAAYDVDKDDISMLLCKTPDASSWSYTDIEDEDYTTTFSVGQKISTVLALAEKADKTNDTILTTFIIYNENEELVSFSHSSATWQSMWYQNYCELDIPGVPAEIGTYKVYIYFNGAKVGSQMFEITA